MNTDFSSFFKNYIDPFDSIDQLMSAIYLVNKLEFLTQSKQEILLKIIENFTSKILKPEQLQLFIYKIEFYEKFYPAKFLKGFENFEIELEKILSESKIESREFLVEIKNCLFCNTFINKKEKFSHKANIYYASKPSALCNITSLKCNYCCIDYFYSYYIKKNQKYFYPDFESKKFIHFSRQTIFQKEVFSMLSADILYKHSSFGSFTKAYNWNFSKKNLERASLIEMR